MELMVSVGSDCLGGPVRLYLTMHVQVDLNIEGMWNVIACMDEWMDKWMIGVFSKNT